MIQLKETELSRGQGTLFLRNRNLSEILDDVMRLDSK